MRFLAADRLAAIDHFAARQRHQAANGAQRRALAGAVGADQAHEFAFVHAQIDPAHRADAAVRDLQAAQFQ
ncbi:hypothetical protein G6F57_021897 [Rhizopus arrhizus]|nr:hypothetical protein G6F57_021897 [Rhizopus arrhizus]